MSKLHLVYPYNAEATFVKSTRSQRFKSKSCHVGIHWKALTECSQMSTHVPGLQSFLVFFLHNFVLAKLYSH